MDRFSISSGLMTASLGQHISELRTQIGKTSTEATTGRYEDLTLHLSGRIGKAMLGQKALADISTDREVLNLRASRLSLIQTSLGTVQESSSGIAANMLSAIGGEHETDVGIAARDAKAALSASLSSLNARYGDRFLFAGDATSTLPFSDQSALLADIELIADSATDSADFATQLDDYFTSPTGGCCRISTKAARPRPTRRASPQIMTQSSRSSEIWPYWQSRVRMAHSPLWTVTKRLFRRHL